MPKFKQRNDVESQPSPPQLSGSSTEPFLGNQTGCTPVQSFYVSKKRQSEIHQHEFNITADDNGDDKIFPPKIATSQNEERLFRDDNTNELYMPLSSKFVLKRKKEILYVLLGCKNGFTIDNLVASGAYVSATAQSERDRIKQQDPANTFKIDDPLNFQIQVANGQLEKPIATATLKFDMGNKNFAEHFVVMRNMTGLIIGLHLMKHNSVVIDTTQRLIHVKHLTMQSKNAAIETSAKAETVLIHDSTTVPLKTTNTITAFVDLASKWNTTGTGTPVINLRKQLISHSVSTIFDRNTAVRITITTESPHLITKSTQTAEFTLVTPEQSKFIEPVDMAILSMIPEGDSDLPTYSSELLKTSQPEQQNNNFWFPSPENLEKLRIIPQYRHKSLENCANCNKNKNWIRKMT